MAKAKISSKDFLDLLDEQNGQPAPTVATFGRHPSPFTPLPNSGPEPTPPKRVANGYQTGSKEVAEQPLINKQRAGEKPKGVAERVAQGVSNGYQTGSKEVADFRLETLSGKERALFEFIFVQCRLAGELTTPPITKEAIAEHLGVTRNRAKNIVRRLFQKNILSRQEFHTGRGGWVKFFLDKDLFQHALLIGMGSKEVANGYQTGSEWVAKQVAQRVAGGSSSSSSIELENLKTTTTSEVELFEDGRIQLAPEWSVIDFSPLSEIGFTQSHLVQLARQGKLTALDAQDSIHFFAFDLKRNEKGRELKGPPLNFFMGILRKGLPYAPPENFVSPEQEARRKFLEGKRRIEERRLAEEKEIQSLDFAEWRRGLTDEQVSTLVPEAVRDIRPARDASLREHFDNEVWPERRLGQVNAEQTEIRQQIAVSLGEVQA